jgi:autoinducer 2 (AI-2) kinase
LSRYVIALDFGHGGAKVLFYDLETGHRFSSYQRWGYFTPENDEYRKEFHPSEFFTIFCHLVSDVLHKQKIKPHDVVGISIACMRHSYVFLDSKGDEIYAGPNTDVRGVFYQDVVESVPLDLYKLTGQGPPLMFMPARLLWFKNERPDVFKQIKYAVTSGDWLLYKLSGVFATEPSLASTTLLFDLEKKQWIPEIMDALDMNDVNLPEVHQAGERIGELTRDVAKQMGLPKETPVAVGGSDTQLGILASGAIADGDLGVVAGTSIPVMMVLSKPVIDPKGRIWTSFHVTPGKWVLEGNGQMGGLIYDWLKDNVQSMVTKNDPETYAYMELLARKIPAGSDGVLASLGSEIFDINTISIVRPGMFRFQQPVHPMNTTPATFGHFIRAALENVAFAVRGNIEQIEEITNKKTSTLRVTGGMSKNSLWAEILAQVTGKNVMVTSIEDGTAMGSALCAAVGAGMYKTLEEAAEDIVHLQREITPDDETVKTYDRCYETWREWYAKLAEM